MRRFLFPLLLLATPAAAADAPTVPLYKIFGRWIVACDNVRTCEARGFEDGPRADLRITRDAGTVPPRATLEADPSPDPTTLQIDGQSLATSGWASDPKEGTLSTTDTPTIDALVARLRDAQKLTFTSPDGPATIPLQGLTAALLLIDAVQGRPGTPTALVAPRGNNGVPGAPGLPGQPRWRKPPPLTTAQAAALIAAARHDPAIIAARTTNDCDSTDRATAHALDDATALVLIPCATAAYQSSSMVLTIPRDGGPPHLFHATLPGLANDAPTQDAFFLNAGFDPDTGTVALAAKERGLADCGLAASWAWSAGTFHLIHLAYQDPCGGARPGDWLTLYRTKAPR